MHEVKSTDQFHLPHCHFQDSRLAVESCSSSLISIGLYNELLIPRLDVLHPIGFIHISRVYNELLTPLLDVLHPSGFIPISRQLKKKLQSLQMKTITSPK